MRPVLKTNAGLATGAAWIMFAVLLTLAATGRATTSTEAYHVYQPESASSPTNGIWNVFHTFSGDGHSRVFTNALTNLPAFFRLRAE